LRIVAVLFVFSVIFGWELLVPGRSLFKWDTLLYNWPLLVETRAQWLAGRFPFWSDSFCCGTPLLANINAGVLYPLRIVCWLLPTRPGYHLFLFLHVWLGFAGMYALARRGFRLGRAASLCGALAFGAGGYARAMWDTHNFMALPWAPLGFAALLGARQTGRFALSSAGAALCWSMMILSGDFQAAALWVPIALSMALFFPERRRLLAAWLAACAAGLLLTAVQWLPASFSAVDSYRAGGMDFQQATERSLHPMRWLELVMPHAFGSHAEWYGPMDRRGDEKLLPWAASIHVGSVAVLLALACLRRLRSPGIRWALFTAVVFGMLSLGRHLPGFALWQRLPLAGSFRYPEKYALWNSLALAAMSAYGWSSVVALRRSRRFAAVRTGVLCGWFAGLAAVALTVAGIYQCRWPYQPEAWNWLAGRAMGFGAVALAFAAWLQWAPSRRRSAALLGVLAVDLALGWFAETPTTRAFDPLHRPDAATLIAESPAPEGRFFCDPAVREAPLPPAYRDLPPTEKGVFFHRARLDFNSQRLWGLRAAGGFSPLESAAMRERRMSVESASRRPDASVAPLAAFCREAAVEWLLTTSSRAADLRKEGLAVETARSWTGASDLALVRLSGAREAEVTPGGDGERIRGIHRFRPGAIRVDLAPGPATRLRVSETYAPGWRARNELGEDLQAGAVGAFLGVKVPEGTTQVRMTYRPIGWEAGAVLSLFGVLALALMLAASAGPDRVLDFMVRPIAPILAGGLVFVIVGVCARSNWGCTFDEGFHLARGLARVELGDSRLSVFHPPLQNMAGGYFAGLAFGDRLKYPDSDAWDAGEVFPYATDLAAANARFYPEVVRASRCGSVVFGALFVAVAVFWAGRSGGPLAGWLAAAGAALAPTFLAHGHLNTTDMGVAALALTGCCLLHVHAATDRPAPLLLAGFAFALAAVSKLSGLVWLAAYVLLCIPLSAALRRDARRFWLIPLTLAVFALLLVILYGPEAQLIRTEHVPWMNGRSMIAGRYVEGLFRQGEHAWVGQQGYFHGRRFVLGAAWHLPVFVMLKTPLAWSLAGVAGLAAWLARKRPLRQWLPALPLLAFAVAACAGNRLAIGVRHALPLSGAAVVLAGVWVARLSARPLRLACATLLAGSSLLAAALGFPDYIGYFPAWAGGVANGHRWLVDSNCDWGQDIERLEQEWAAVVRANRGEPPDLVYFGFVDPRLIYGMPAGARSWCGFMHNSMVGREGREAHARWQESLSGRDNVVVASVSSLKLMPEKTGLVGIEQRPLVGRLANAFFVYDARARRPPRAP
jgi:hypothetical protein